MSGRVKRCLFLRISTPLETHLEPVNFIEMSNVSVLFCQ